MADFNLTITDEGAAFLASVIANQGNIDFTEVRFSSNNYVGQESSLTEGTWAGTFITAAPSASVVDLTIINIDSSFDNSSFTADHDLYSIGVIGDDGNTTALIAVATTSTPDIILKFILNASTYAYNIDLAVSSTANITVSASTAGVLFVSDIVDDLNRSNTNKPLSANQGKELNDAKAEREDISSIITTGATNTIGSAITAGTYFYLNGVLCKALADIAVNASFTLNTNYEPITIGEQLSANSTVQTDSITVNTPFKDVVADIRKQNNVVSVRISGGWESTIITGYSYTIGTLSSDFRPGFNISTSCELIDTNADAVAIAHCAILTTGAIIFRIPTSVTISSYSNFNILITYVK